MRFRIVGNGETIRVQRKKLFGWDWDGWVTGAYDCKWVQPHEFDSVQEAADHIRKNYGSSARIERPWTVLAPPAPGAERKGEPNV